ncbi:MAG: 4-(cytidine 5'-diphospho)-2-C-methyl-D-erythritol kinase [Lawsonibacter sp.]|nr:4-(cytidine 5'-diphospho)-2-C-methyl-D-erythritol kinase [Lawsonibacter sp.]
MSVQARAKLNLTLDVLGRRPDGYHELCMVMQSVQLCDVLEIAPGEGRVSSNLGYLPTGEKNLAWAAARRFWEALGRPQPPLDIHIEKRIPVCAGMAGGSSDAAAVLRELNRREGDPFTLEQLMKIGGQVGSDVPYCVLGGTALARGRGEVLTALPPLPRCHVVLCKPDFSISTPELFARADAVKLRRRPDTAGVLAALEAGDLEGTARRMYNIFEDVLPPRQAARVTEIKHTLIECGALGAAMSGTGPTAFGLFAGEEQARLAWAQLAETYQDVWLTETV